MPRRGCPSTSVLTHPTTAGVMASYATLGDLIIAEPAAMIGFAGPRVIKDTTQAELPPGFQTAEFLLERGLIDAIVPRRELKERLSFYLEFLMSGAATRLVRTILFAPIHLPRKVYTKSRNGGSIVVEPDLAPFLLCSPWCPGRLRDFSPHRPDGDGNPVNGRYKAFLFVGIAYFFTAVLAPAALLFFRGASWSFPATGAWWSLIAGTVGAIGAFGVLLAFGAKGTPPVVMSIVFAGAPVVNAVVSLLMHPPKGGWAW